jgi:hypothetical protein
MPLSISKFLLESLSTTLEGMLHSFFINWYPLQILYTEAIEVCNKEINYARRGWKSLEQHLKKKLHIDNLKIKGLTIVCLLYPLQILYTEAIFISENQSIERSEVGMYTIIRNGPEKSEQKS